MRVHALLEPSGGRERGNARPTVRADADARLVALVHSHAPLRVALARIAARLVATRAWERLGFARLADYARERVGISARQLQDLAHVSDALARLPRVEAALLAGVLSWSKARLLCRVARAEDEAAWVAFARRVRVHALEREVRRIDRGALEAAVLPISEDAGDNGEPREGVLIACTPAVRGKWWRARLLAQRVAGERLAPWACMKAVMAEVLSALPQGAEEDSQGSPPADPADPAADMCEEAELHTGICWQDAAHPDRRFDSTANVCASDEGDEAPAQRPALPPFLRPLVEGLDDSCAVDAFALDERLRRAVALEQRVWAEVGEWLAVVVTSRRHVRHGFRSLEAYAHDRLGISPRKARSLLRLERAAARCPALLRAYRDGRLSWVQAQVLLPILLGPGATEFASDLAADFAAQWVVHAAHVSVRRLEDDVERALAFDRVEPPSRQTCAPPPGSAEPAAATPQEPQEHQETGELFFWAPRSVAHLFRVTICSVRRHIERRSGHLPSVGEAVGAMLDHALAAWGADDERVARTHRVFARDGWRCTAPGCTSFRNLHDHHIVFRSAGGSNDLTNRTTLCAWHHLRGVHAGVVRCTGVAPDGLRFELGVRREGAAAAVYGAGEVVVAK